MKPSPAIAKQSAGTPQPKPRKRYDTSNRPRTSSKASGHRGLYDSPEWRARRKAQLAEHPECINIKLCGRLATTADHVERVTDPNSRAQVLEGELQSMCWPCHQQKSADDRATAAGRKPKPIKQRVEIDPATGYPLTGQAHPWSE